MSILACVTCCPEESTGVLSTKGARDRKAPFLLSSGKYIKEIEATSGIAIITDLR